jgi:hypothetical protein
MKLPRLLAHKLAPSPAPFPLQTRRLLNATRRYCTLTSCLCRTQNGGGSSGSAAAARTAGAGRSGGARFVRFSEKTDDRGP